MISSYLTDSAFTAVKRGPKVLNIVGMWKEYHLSIEGIQKRPDPVGNILTRIWPWSIHIKLNEKDHSDLKTAKRPNLKVRLRTYVPPPPPALALLVGLTKGVLFLTKKGKMSGLGAEPSCKKLCWVLPQRHKNWEGAGGKQDTHQELLIEAG